MDTRRKASLVEELGQLLGFEDGAEDVLDNLIKIQDSDDLLDYLSQLLGTRNEKVQAFVDRVHAIHDHVKTETPLSNQSQSSSSVNPPVKKAELQKGKAAFVCGCFGTKHKPLANCLVCGRISCEREGFDYCAFCGFLVERPPQGVSRNDAAWLHKERLLQFDRESAQRMVVIDDQSDFAATHQMTWLTENEASKAQEEQADRERTMQQRPKMQLDLAL